MSATETVHKTLFTRADAPGKADVPGGAAPASTVHSAITVMQITAQLVGPLRRTGP